MRPVREPNRLSSSPTAGNFCPPARKARLRPQFSASTGAERTWVREHRSAAKTQAPVGICGRANRKDFGSSAIQV